MHHNYRSSGQKRLNVNLWTTVVLQQYLLGSENKSACCLWFIQHLVIRGKCYMLYVKGNYRAMLAVIGNIDLC